MPRFNDMHLVITQEMVTCINMEEKLVLKNLLKNRMSISSAAISPKLKNYSRVILMIHSHAVFIEPNPYVRCDTTMSLYTYILLSIKICIRALFSIALYDDDCLEHWLVSIIYEYDLFF